MDYYIAEPMSRNSIRLMANRIHKLLHIDNLYKIPIVELLDIFSEILESFSYEIVEDNTFETDVHAKTDPYSGKIYIKQSVYENALLGKGRDRMTIAHEIGHFLLHSCKNFCFERNFDNKKIPPYKSCEWQAKCFAAEFLMPYNLIKDMAPEEIADKCDVSLSAAKYQWKINKDKGGTRMNLSLSFK